MTEMFRCRVDKTLLDQVKRISRDLGTSTGEMVRIFMKQTVKRHGLPFSMTVDDNFDLLPDRDRQSESLAEIYGK